MKRTKSLHSTIVNPPLATEEEQEYMAEVVALVMEMRNLQFRPCDTFVVNAIRSSRYPLTRLCVALIVDTGYYTRSEQRGLSYLSLSLSFTP